MNTSRGNTTMDTTSIRQTSHSQCSFTITWVKVSQKISSSWILVSSNTTYDRLKTGGGSYVSEHLYTWQLAELFHFCHPLPCLAKLLVQPKDLFNNKVRACECVRILFVEQRRVCACVWVYCAGPCWSCLSSDLELLRSQCCWITRRCAKLRSWFTVIQYFCWLVL